MHAHKPLGDDELAQRHREGASIQLLAALCRQPDREVRERLRGLGLQVTTGYGPGYLYRPKEKAELSELLVRWRASGSDIRVLIKGTGIGYGEMVDLLVSADSDMPQRGPKGELPCPVPPERLRQRYLKDLESIAAIARDYRATEAAVRRWLLDAGVELRGYKKANAAIRERNRRVRERA
ncbi:hypothetical protein [Streptomyces sp. URMC 129]|uniref:hypothetical protein n=1 Tax=Streptomyces sp. URMC 129 TaxID=3423407 RepID=UPI003F1CC982